MATKFKKEIIFTTEIDYNYNYKNKGYSLSPIRNNKELDNISVEKIEKISREIIEITLPKDIESIFGIIIKTKILKKEYGSIIFFFSVLFTGYTLFSNYKGFYDSLELIKRQTSRLLKSGINSMYGDMFDVTTNIEFPSFSEPLYSKFVNRFLKRSKHFEMLLHEFPESLPLFYQHQNIHPQRDGFFYFLLTTTIIFGIIIGFLVYGAVIKTYF